MLEQPHRAVLATRRTWDGSGMVAVHNLGALALRTPLRLEGCAGGTRLVDLLHGDELSVDDQGAVEVDLDAYGYRWLRVVPPGDRRLV